MMDKKSANGFPSKAGEGGVQRKQLPYSVETPYGFHLDLDFLKYVDDIEKGNTIKRVHIQRRARGPKFSTLPRNFSLPGHGARPTPKDSAWSGTSTLGPKPKSRVTEVQQIFDFRPSDGGTTSCQTSRVTASQGSFSLAKPREEAGAGARGLEEQPFGLQGRPNLLRASSMPVTVQHRKASDSSSPDRVVGTPENGSSENVFRASADVTERRCVPQDRGGLHQQITVALKRVRELEEQVRTIPELKAQICSLRGEREKLILQLQAQAKLQAKASVSASSSNTAPSTDPGAHAQPQRPRAPAELGSPLVQKPIEPEVSLRALGRLSEEQPTGKEKEGGVDVSRVSQIERETHHESVKSSAPEGGAGGVLVQEPEIQAQPSEKSDRQIEALVSQVERGAEQLSEDITAQKLTPHPAETTIVTVVSCVKEGILGPYVASDEDLASVHQLQAKLTALEAKLTQASQELETTNSLLREQVEENKLKEEKILQLSEGVEVCAPETRARRDSVDRGTETEKVVISNQETETEVADTVDQGTDTEKICIEIYSPGERAGSIDQGTATERVDTHDQVTETGAETAVNVHPARRRANSVDQGTETERVDTQDQVTETPVADRVDRVTETVAVETVTDHPMRPRASSVDQGTETERVGTVDRVTETEAAQRADQQTETERERRQDNNPSSAVETESQVTESAVSERVVETDIVVTERVGGESVVTERVDGESRANEGVIGENVASESVVTERVDGESRASEGVIGENVASESVVTEVAITESLVTENAAKESVVKNESETCENYAVVASVETETESKIEDDWVVVVTNVEQEIKDSVAEASKSTFAESAVIECVEMEKVLSEPVVEQQTVKLESEVMSITTKETVTESVTESVVIVVSESSAVKTVAPVRPQRGRRPSTEQSQTQAPSHPQPQPEHQAQPKPQLQAPPQQPCEAQKQPSEPQTPPQPETQAQGSSQVQDQAPPQRPRRGSSETPKQPSEPQTPSEPQSPPQAEAQAPPQRPLRASTEAQPQAQTQVPSKASPEGSSEVCTKPQPPQPQTQSQPKPKASGSRRDSKELQPKRRGSGDTQQPPRRGSSEVQAHPTRRGSSESQPQAKGSRRGSGESQTIRRGSGEAQARRGSGEGQAQGGCGSSEAQAQASRRDSGEAQQLPRKGSSESPTSPAALGQVVTRITGLLGEQWAQLGSSSGAQQGASQQESPAAQKQTVKQTTGKRAAAAGKGASVKPAGKAAAAAAAAAAGKPAGKPGPSKMSSIQSQLVSSLSALSAFYSPVQKAAAASKQEQGLKSIMKKDGVADKQGNGATKKNLKFVGVNGGYETTSSEESSGDEKTREKEEEKEEEEEDSSEPEVEQPKEETQSEEPQEEAGGQGEVAEASAQGEGAVAGEKEAEGAPQDPETSEELQEEQATGGQVDKGFLDACLYVKDRMGEVSSPDKEMRQILLVLYQEWFRVSSQKDSQADTVTVYLRQVSQVTPTLLGYVINLTDGNGNTALHYSVSHSNFPVVKLLLDTGLCETDNVNKAGYTPVMLAALTAADSPDDLEVALQLLRHGGINTRSSQAGQTALMLAVSHGRVAMVRLLLSCDADVNAQDRDGSTALMCACEHGHAHIARLLLETGHCHTGLTDKDGQTALSVATGASHQDIVDLLNAHAEGGASDPASSMTPH